MKFCDVFSFGRFVLLVMAFGFSLELQGQTVSIDISPSGRGQVIDGFGTCVAGTEGQQSWWQQLYFEDLKCSILRMDLTPPFKAPYTGVNGTYNSPWFHNNPSLPGPENNNVRTYTGAADYKRLYNGWRAPIAVMGPDINANTNLFNFNHERPRIAGLLAKLGASQKTALGDFKLIGSLWSPAPWLKVSSGNTISGHSWPLPVDGTPWPFVWYDNFSGGKLDTSGTPLPDFDDSALGGTGPTSALTQFARCTAAYLRGFQEAYQVRFYAISIQNEVNFEEFYNSCSYPLSTGYIAALKAVRLELDKYPDLASIRIMGPEDLLGGDAYGLWQYGGGSTTVHKNLQYLQNLAADPEAAAAIDFFCIHGYASDGVSAANATPTLWNWWVNGWSGSPAPGIPSNVKGYAYYNKRSWMTETSGENPEWLYPQAGYPSGGAWSLGLRIHQALTAGRQSAWVYWQLSDGSSAVGAQTLTSAAEQANSAKYVAAKHFFRHIRPGSVRVTASVSDAPDVLASAYMHETNRTITVVLLNTAAAARSVTVEVPPVSGIGFWQVYSSSAGALWQESAANIANESASVDLPGYGIVTLYGVAAPRLQATALIGGEVSLTWEQAAVGFVLQSASEPKQSANWTTEAMQPVISGNVAKVTLPAATGARYYRLKLP